MQIDGEPWMQPPAEVSKVRPCPNWKYLAIKHDQKIVWWPILFLFGHHVRTCWIVFNRIWMTFNCKWNVVKHFVRSSLAIQLNINICGHQTMLIVFGHQTSPVWLNVYLLHSRWSTWIFLVSCIVIPLMPITVLDQENAQNISLYAL